MGLEKFGLSADRILQVMLGGVPETCRSDVEPFEYCGKHGAASIGIIGLQGQYVAFTPFFDYYKLYGNMGVHPDYHRRFSSVVQPGVLERAVQAATTEYFDAYAEKYQERETDDPEDAAYIASLLTLRAFGKTRQSVAGNDPFAIDLRHPALSVRACRLPGGQHEYSLTFHSKAAAAIFVHDAAGLLSGCEQQQVTGGFQPLTTEQSQQIGG